MKPTRPPAIDRKGGGGGANQGGDVAHKSSSPESLPIPPPKTFDGSDGFEKNHDTR